MKFKVLAGKHSQKGPDGRPIVYITNEIVESKTDLEAKFNAGRGAMKFERVADNTVASLGHYVGGAPVLATQPVVIPDQSHHANVPPQQLQQQPQPQTQPHPKLPLSPQVSAQLDSMSLKDLHIIAAEQQLDLKGVTDRKEVIKSIKATLPT